MHLEENNRIPETIKRSVHIFLYWISLLNGKANVFLTKTKKISLTKKNRGIRNTNKRFLN